MLKAEIPFKVIAAAEDRREHGKEATARACAVKWLHRQHAERRWRHKVSSQTYLKFCALLSQSKVES
jgi:hypothetical protein